MMELMRRLICNLATGVQFLGKESNSHYHLHLSCLKSADVSFTGKDLMVPDDIKPALSAVQKMYLATCFDDFVTLSCLLLNLILDVHVYMYVCMCTLHIH